MPASPSVILKIALDVPSADCFDYAPPTDAPPTSPMMEWIGRRALVPWGRRQMIGIILAVTDHTALPADKLRAAIAVLDDAPVLDAQWRALTQFAATYYQRGTGESMVQSLPMALRQAAAYRSDQHGQWVMPALKTVRKKLTALRREPVGEGASNAVQRPHLNDEQARALADITSAMDQADAAPRLLFGVTGSGKTEVYLHAVEAALARGHQALVLVPEINLTPQLAARFTDRFPNRRVMTMHSGLAEGQRTLTWMAGAEGLADVVLGTRLASFVPLPRLGLIVVDEEHDASYKQQEGLRYSARDLAVWRGRDRQVPVVLGSATPSLESWANAQSGRYRPLPLTQRAHAQARLPTIELIDTARDKLDGGVTTAARIALTNNLASGGQSLVFLNRRGYAPVLSCAACGWVASCARCSAHAVFHRFDGRLHCHHCGWNVRTPAACPTCGNIDLAPLGRGTQRIEESLAALLPSARIARIDADSTRRKGSAQAMFDQVHAGEIDLLIGTQMIVKGHDFSRVNLVVVLGADASLFSHDFRAPERLFQQLMQVAGRSGRAEVPGRVLLQTRYPKHPLFPALIAHDYAAFANEQLNERRSAGLPPITHQAMLRAQAKQLDNALSFLAAAKALANDEAVRVYDVVPMSLVRLAGIERAQLLVESPSRAKLQAFLPRWIEAFSQQPIGRDQGGVKWHVEVDPLDI